VGGLSRNTTDSEFRSYFEPFGTIKDAQVLVDRETGQGRGFGFVSFESDKTVDTIMTLQHEIGGKVVELRRAEPKRPLLSSFDHPDSGGREFAPPRFAFLYYCFFTRFHLDISCLLYSFMNVCAVHYSYAFFFIISF
jgi:RNA recognition motif-containing protein